MNAAQAHDLIAQRMHDDRAAARHAALASQFAAQQNPRPGHSVLAARLRFTAVRGAAAVFAVVLCFAAGAQVAQSVGTAGHHTYAAHYHYKKG